MNRDIQNVAVIGAGSMGHGIAQSALLAGLTVYLYDVEEEYLQAGVEKIFSGLEKMVVKDQITETDASVFKNNLTATVNLEKAVSQADFVFEAVPEVLELKQDVFKQLDALAPRETILATNTSNMSISSIADATLLKDRVVGVHFFIPVVLMKLVEVIRGNDTSDEVMQVAYDLCAKMNKTPVRVEKDRPGFIVNRVNGPIRVFLSAIVESGIAEPEEIDALMRYNGLPIGYFELADYIGLDVVYFSAEYRKQALHPEYGPNQMLLDKINANHLGRKKGKGFYDWTNGRPVIDLNKRTDKIKIEDIEFVKFNEAAKLIEEGVSTPKDIDKAMKLGTGYEEGPIAFVKRYNINDVISRLEQLASEYKREVLKPAQILTESPEKVIHI